MDVCTFKSYTVEELIIFKLKEGESDGGTVLASKR